MSKKNTEEDFSSYLEELFGRDFHSSLTDTSFQLVFLQYLVMKDDCQRVAYTIKQDRDKMKTDDFSKPEYDQKSEVQANEIRDRGNQKLGTSTEECVTLYTESIAHAPHNSVALSFGYANRAVALFHLKKYEAAIADNQRALIAGYPEELHYKLYVRLANCYEAMCEFGKALTCYKNSISKLCNAKMSHNEKENFKCDNILPGLTKLCSVSMQEKEAIDDLTQDPSVGVPRLNTPNLSDNSNPELPSAANCTSLQYNKTYGRHLVATRDIEIGEPIIVEEPFAAFLSQNFRYTHCSHCFKRCDCLQPCPQCSWTLFCSIKCMDEAKIYHVLECALMPSVFKNENHKLDAVKLAGRIVTVHGLEHIEEFLLNNYEPDPERHTDEEKRTAGFHKDGKYISSDLNTIANLCFHSSEDFEWHLNIVFKVVDLMQLLKLNNLKCSYRLGGFLAKYLLSTKVNGSNGINVYFNKGRDLKNIAVGIYPTFSLLNHSCAPNTYHHFYGKTLVVRALKSIRKGEQIFQSNGKLFTDNSLEDRQKYLLQTLHFKCQCEACANKWPMHDDMPFGPLLNSSKDSKIILKLKSAQMELVRNHAMLKDFKKISVTLENFSLFRNYVKLLEKYKKVHCQLYYYLLECLRTFFLMQGNFVNGVKIA